LAVVGFDNIELGGAPAYGLTSYHQPTDKMIDAIVAMITGRRASETIVFPGSIIRRLSA
jgi:DNA-binding LacI/PurR family transcriptional regulator